jgi:hypothetical protein
MLEATVILIVITAAGAAYLAGITYAERSHRQSLVAQLTGAKSEQTTAAAQLAELHNRLVTQVAELSERVSMMQASLISSTENQTSPMFPRRFTPSASPKKSNG